MNITFIYFVLKQNRNSRNLLVCTNYFQSPVGRTVQTAAYYIQKYCHHCHHEWTFIKRILFKSNGCQREKGFLQYKFLRFFRQPQTEQFWQQSFAHTYPKIITIWYWSENQFMTPSILPKNERICFWKNGPRVVRSNSFSLFVCFLEELTTP